MHMHPGGDYPRANTPSSGRYGSTNGGGGGFRYGRGPPPYRGPPSPPPEQQMTPREKEQVLMAAGRLAAEFLVDRGDLPPDALDNRPPAPIPFQHGPPPLAPHAFRFQGRSPAPPQQHYRQPGGLPRPFHFFQGQHQQQRPPAPQWRFSGPRHQFQGGHGPFPKRPRQGPGPPRSFPYGGPRAPGHQYPPPPPPPAKTTTTTGQGAAAAPPVAESATQEDKGNGTVAGEAGGPQQTTAQPGGATSGAPQQMSVPSSSSVGADESKPS